MDTAFFIAFAAILAFDGVLMQTLSWAAKSERFSKYRIRTPSTYQIPKTRLMVNTQLNNVLSLSVFAAFFYFLGDWAMYPGWPGAAHAWRSGTLTPTWRHRPPATSATAPSRPGSTCPTGPACRRRWRRRWKRPDAPTSA